LFLCHQLRFLRIVSSSRSARPNNWDGGASEIGQRAGIFRRHGPNLEILYTNGGGETMQAVISGSVDIGISAGTSTHITLPALIQHFNVSAKPVATGASALTLTQARSGQIDVGWASPPFGLDALDDGQIRLVARAFQTTGAAIAVQKNRPAALA
jgi:ABC-type nitrate/sulfonate/bicarbonate transport system substrate-binding protein